MSKLISPFVFHFSSSQDGGASGETNLAALLKNSQPLFNEGEYVFCTVSNDFLINSTNVVCSFKEKEGTTLILDRNIADSLHLPYSYVASWITLNVHSSLEATGLTAAFSKALAEAGISCNVVAAYYHDHIFVDNKDAEKAMAVLRGLSGKVCSN